MSNQSGANIRHTNPCKARTNWEILVFCKLTLVNTSFARNPMSPPKHEQVQQGDCMATLKLSLSIGPPKGQFIATVSRLSKRDTGKQMAGRRLPRLLRFLFFFFAISRIFSLYFIGGWWVMFSNQMLVKERGFQSVIIKKKCKCMQGTIGFNNYFKS